MLKIFKVNTNKDFKKFINLPWDLYSEDNNWVPPLKKDLMNTITGKNNPLYKCGPVSLFIAEKNNKVVGRIMVGIDEKLNKEKQFKRGYISLFESVKDKEIAFKLFNTAETWLKERGIEEIWGPVSPTKGDDYKGLLVKGFDGSPVLLNSYNPIYYENFLIDYKFKKERDSFAYFFSPKTFPKERYDKVVNYAMKKFNFHINSLNLKNIDEDIKNVYEILKQSLPQRWNMTIPSVDEIKKEFTALLPFIDPELIYIARKNDTNEPIGFVVAAPDYNQVLKKMNGNLFPLGILKFYYYKKRISAMRIFIQFVIPKYEGKAVNGAIFYQLFKKAREKGIVSVEGSTIGEDNIRSIKSVEDAGGIHYRTYRIYNKIID